MWKAIQARLFQKYRTNKFPDAPPNLPEHFRGWPEFDNPPANAALRRAAGDVCPVEAIDSENNSIDETMLNLIYSRSVRILKGKVDTAGEMVRTLSKILSAHMNESFVTRSARRLCE